MQTALTDRKGFAPATIAEAMEFAQMLAASSMVPKAYQGKPQDIMVCVQWGYEIGLAPMQALQNIAVINGKPSVFGDAALALVQASPVCEDVEEYIEGEGTTNPVAVCVAKRKGRKPVVARFSVEDAKRAGLWGKGGPWSAYPKRMMQMRARGFALRDAFPDVLRGLITAEEAQDYPDEAVPVVKDITPRNPLDVIAAPVEPPALTVEPELTDLKPEQEDVKPEQVRTLPEPAQDVAPVGYALLVPGRDQPFSVHQTLDEWADAYEELAEKTALAGKVPPRDRLAKIKELKQVNKETLDRIDTLKRVRHTASHQRRVHALGDASKG